MQSFTRNNGGACRGRPRAVLCVVGLIGGVAVLLLANREPSLYRVVTLPTCGDRFFEPYAMNDCGQIVGVVEATGGGRYIALWDREQGVRELGIAFDGPVSINNRGQIAGTTTDPNLVSKAFLWDPQTGLTQRGQPLCCAMAINNRGQVVGQCSSFTSPAKVPQACIWEGASVMRDCNLLSARGRSVAHHINDHGQILGLFGEGVESQSCLWDLADPNLTECIPLPGDGAAYSGLNNAGYVLGEMLRPAEGSDVWPEKYAVLWHKDRDWIWLFPLGDLNTHAFWVNDANQVVYWETHRSVLTNWFPRWFPPRSRFFLWDPMRGRVSLDAPLRLERNDQLSVRDLNNDGCIVGVVSFAGGTRKRAVLLEPIARKWRR